MDDKKQPAPEPAKKKKGFWSKVGSGIGEFVGQILTGYVENRN